jgi:23S rRNA pseudouridine2605 synthase
MLSIIRQTISSGNSVAFVTGKYSAKELSAPQERIRTHFLSNRFQGSLIRCYALRAGYKSAPKRPGTTQYKKKRDILYSKPKPKPEGPKTSLTREMVGRLENALKQTSTDSATAEKGVIQERVAKRIARCGLCSRREAEQWIRMGRVSVDGKILDELGTVVSPGQVLAVDGIPIRAEPPKLFIFNKVRNMLITRSETDGKGRETLGQLLAEMGEPTLLPVGRLDFSSEGLLLLTNDGVLKRYLEHPDSNLLRVYRVRVYGRVKQQKFDGLENGIEIDGFKYRGVKVKVENALDRKGPTPAPQWRVKESGNIPTPDARANTWLTVELREGKNREIRKIMEHFGLEVSRLIRIQYGPYRLTPDVESGMVKPVTIAADLKPHTNQDWDWHAKQTVSTSPDSPSSLLRVPKSKPPPNRKKPSVKDDSL